MQGRDKILAAFEPEGSSDIGAVACYDGIFLRDHWRALTNVSWWHAWSGVKEEEDAWVGDYQKNCGLDWLTVKPCRPRVDRPHMRYQRRDNGVWALNTQTGDETRLTEPIPGGPNTPSAASKYTLFDSPPETRSEIDRLVPIAHPFDADAFRGRGQQDTSVGIRESTELLTYGHVASPLWGLYNTLGYEWMMVFLAEDPGLAAYAGRRLLSLSVERIKLIETMGADAVWIEECLTDQISPKLFGDLNVPLVRRCVEEIHDRGMKSIYYYCGNPHDRLDLILDCGADAIHFEETKKNFTIDIENVVDQVDGRCVVFGNIDAIDLLPNGSRDELELEIRRQIRAGRRNGGRFVLSTGSPITPGTSVGRVRFYTDTARTIARREGE